jgi:hypothetical protein
MFEEVNYTVPPTTKVTKKRKVPENDTEKDELKHEARTLCCSSEQWKVVCKYPTSKLREWVDMKKFESDRKVADSMVQRGIQLFGSAVDLALGGGGCIASEFESDVVLTDSVKQEAGGFLRLLNNKIRILFCTANNVAVGYSKRPASTITIEEEKDVLDEEINSLDMGAPDNVNPTERESREEGEEDASAEVGGATFEVPMAADRADGWLLSSAGEEGSWENFSVDQQLTEGVTEGNFQLCVDCVSDSQDAASFPTTRPERD